MYIHELQERVNKATEKVEKCRGTIERHNKQLEKKIKSGTATAYDIRCKEDDIKGAMKKLAEAERVLEGWVVKLNVEVQKEEFINNSAPPVIRKFLDQWKDLAYQWYIKRFSDFLVYKEKLAQKVELAQKEYIEKYVVPESAQNQEMFQKYGYSFFLGRHNRKMDAFLKEKNLYYSQVKSAENAFAGAIVLKMYDYRFDEEEMLKYLNKVLEEERKSKLIDLINRVTSCGGKIQDATYLTINNKGMLDGFLKCEKGRVKVETIGAGGFNIQCFHFRTLVHLQG